MPRNARMLSQDELAEILSVDRLHLPAEPRVLALKPREFEDSTGDDSLEVYVVVDDATPESDWTWRKFEPVYDAVREALRGAGESRLPYFTAGTREDYEQRFTYDPGEDE